MTVGRVDGRPFLEVAAIGLFGEGLQLGQAVKELRFGALGAHFRDLLTAQRFRYRLTGDIEVLLRPGLAGIGSTSARQRGPGQAHPRELRRRLRGCYSYPAGVSSR